MPLQYKNVAKKTYSNNNHSSLPFSFPNDPLFVYMHVSAVQCIFNGTNSKNVDQASKTTIFMPIPLQNIPNVPMLKIYRCMYMKYAWLLNRASHPREPHRGCRFLALLDFVSRATVVTEASVIHPLTHASQKPLHGPRLNFVESHLSTISPGCFILFSYLLIFNFLRFFFFIFVNMGTHGGQNFKMLVLLQFRSYFNQTLC